MKLKVLILALQLIAHGSDAYLTHRAVIDLKGRELNPIMRPWTKSTPKLVVGFSLATGGPMIASHLFRRSGHLKIARGIELIDIGTTVGSAGFTADHSTVDKKTNQ